MTMNAESLNAIRGRIEQARSTTEADSIHDVIYFHVDELEMNIEEALIEAEDLLCCTKALQKTAIVRLHV